MKASQFGKHKRASGKSGVAAFRKSARTRAERIAAKAAAAKSREEYQ